MPLNPTHWTFKFGFSLHSGGFSSPIVPQEGCDLAFIEIDAETVDSWTRSSIKHFHQVLDLHPHHQAHWVRLEEQLTCMRERFNTSTEK